MRRPILMVPVVLVLLLTGGCSADPDGPPAAVPAPPPSTTSSLPVAPEATSGSPSAVTRVAAEETLFFTSPTGNIACSMGLATATCEIEGATFQPPARPADCDLDHGTMLGIDGSGPARFLCHGDTAFGAAGSVLEYGERSTNGLVTCTSRESGMTCSSADGSHGFELSRAAYRLY